MFLLWTLIAIVCLTCLIGGALHFQRERTHIPAVIGKSLIGGMTGFFFIACAVVISTIFTGSPIYAQEVANTMPETAYGLGFLGAGVSVGLACVGTGIATGMSASAAIGAVSEDPKMLGTSLLFVGLSEGIAIYGLIVAIMILGRLG